MEKRPASLPGYTKMVKTGCGKIYVTVTFYKGRVFEIFANIGKAGGCASSQTEAIGRLISFAAREGADLTEVVEQLSGITCHVVEFKGEQQACAHVIAQVLKEALATLSDSQVDQTTAASGSEA